MVFIFLERAPAVAGIMGAVAFSSVVVAVVGSSKCEMSSAAESSKRAGWPGAQGGSVPSAIAEKAGKQGERGLTARAKLERGWGQGGAASR